MLEPTLYCLQRIVNFGLLGTRACLLGIPVLIVGVIEDILVIVLAIVLVIVAGIVTSLVEFILSVQIFYRIFFIEVVLVLVLGE